MYAILCLPFALRFTFFDYPPCSFFEQGFLCFVTFGFFNTIVGLTPNRYPCPYFSQVAGTILSESLPLLLLFPGRGHDSRIIVPSPPTFPRSRARFAHNRSLSSHLPMFAGTIRTKNF